MVYTEVRLHYITIIGIFLLLGLLNLTSFITWINTVYKTNEGFSLVPAVKSSRHNSAFDPDRGPSVVIECQTVVDTGRQEQPTRWRLVNCFRSIQEFL